MRSLPVLPPSAGPDSSQAREKEKGGAGLTAERLFRDVFARLYAPGANLDELRRTDANPANNPAILATLDETADVFAKLAPSAFEASELVLDRSDASVHHLATLLTLEARTRLLAPKGSEPPRFAQLVIHGAIYVGACVVKNHGGRWLVRRPLWESRVELTSKAGVAELSPFAWWLKSMSDDEVGKATLLDRYRTHVEVPRFDPSTLAIIAPPDRRLPQLAKVRYDLFHKYLKAHLPELRDLGRDFPSPERFQELGFQSLELVLVGGGRVVIAHGRTEHGVAALFLSKDGFLKQHYYACGKGAQHRLEVSGDVVRFVIDDGGAPSVHETLFWGG